MNSRRIYSPATVVVLALLILLVPLLAYLQYTWVGQLSEREYDRMKNALRSSAFNLGMVLNRELTDLVRTVGVELEGSPPDARLEVAKRVARWKETALYPALVDTSFLGSAPSGLRVIPVVVDEHSSVLCLEDLSAIAIPIKGVALQCVFLKINMEYVRSLLLPDLVRSYFSSGGEVVYDVIVFDKRHNVFFSSFSPGLEDRLSKADAVLPFIYFPHTPISMTPTGSMPPPPPEFNLDRENPGERDGGIRPPTGDRWLEKKGGPADRGLRASAFFEMHIRHRDGSVEQAVSHMRSRNLAVSFGILLMLGASVVFLLVSSSRSERLARQQLEFVAGISHELRTPLAVLRSAGENLADGVISGLDRARQYGEVIKQEVSRLSDMVEKALAYAGIQSGKRIYELHPHDIAQVVDEALHSIRHKVTDEVTIETSIARDLPSIPVDTTAMQSAIENLLTNAIKYGGENPRVDIEVHSVENGNGQFVEICVRDRGIGIPPADKDQVFQPFHRAQNAIDLQIPGSGLGLSIARHIVEGHGGTISIESSPKAGTVFTIRIPAIPDHGASS